ncbi:MAG: PEP-CTERM sorting domain-containing protein, partial [Phycisphaerales bacterium]
LTVDVNLMDTGVGEIDLRRVALDFTQSDPALSLDPRFSFACFYCLPYVKFPELPLPSLTYTGTDPMPGFMLTLPAGGSVHLGSIGLTVPSSPWGGCILDVVNYGARSPNEGARFDFDFEHPTMLHSTTGEISGGILDLGIPEPGTLSLLALGGIAVVRRRR